MSAASEKLGEGKSQVFISEKLIAVFDDATGRIVEELVEVHPVPEGREPVKEVIRYDAKGQLSLPGYWSVTDTKRTIIH
ncbi:hypothetical protein EPN29_14285 [bacterium]|nr:MAG: hypothetical protein EPN29_14285 [bacterium]